jgi:hypothetical protein
MGGIKVPKDFFIKKARLYKRLFLVSLGALICSLSYIAMGVFKCLS